MILMMLQACTLVILREVYYSIRYRCVLIIVRCIIKCIKGVAWR